MTSSMVWMRNDLRLSDNPALSKALTLQRESGPDHTIHLVFYVTPTMWVRHQYGEAKIDLIRRSLLSLAQSCRHKNLSLDVVKVCSTAELCEDLIGKLKKYQCQHLLFNREYPLDERRRDAYISRHCISEGIATESFDDRAMFAPELIETQQGGAYKVFTPFKRRWLSLLSESDQSISLSDADQYNKKTAKVCCDQEINDCFIDLYHEIISGLWPAGEDEAKRRLKFFCKNKIDDYQQARDLPAEDGTSTLSPYLAIGSISVRQCLQALLQGSTLTITDLISKGRQTWLSELIWRDFYQYLAFHFPELSKGLPFKPQTQWLAWRNSEADFQAWCEGRTGIPIIDAAMQQLVATGWMHNRLRMITAMFLSKHLLINWRRGEAFFMQHLIDGDFCANNGGWQWSASTGADAVPYFRIFNPVTQSERFDGDAEFILRYFPELAVLPKKQRHFPNGQANYPKPIVDLKEGRLRALATFKAIAAGEH